MTGLFDCLDMLLDTIDHKDNSSKYDNMSNAQVENEMLKEHADRGAYMEYLIEKETNPVIKKKLEWRLNSAIYEWEDLYK